MTKNLHSQSGKYLTFFIAEEMYGVPIEMVREIIGSTKITQVPESPKVVKGVINLRGKIVPMISIRTKFGLEEVSFRKETCFIIIDVGTIQVGVIVDTVKDVKEFTKDQLELADEMHGWHANEYLIGMGKTADQTVVILIDLAKALSSESFASIITEAKSLPSGEEEDANHKNVA